MPVELLRVKGKDVEVEAEVGFNDGGPGDAVGRICGGSDDESCDEAAADDGGGVCAADWAEDELVVGADKSMSITAAESWLG
jgi:hypothetical protein